LSVQLISKISNLCDPDPPTSQTGRQTDRRTTSNLNTALCTSASRGKKRSKFNAF